MCLVGREEPLAHLLSAVDREIAADVVQPAVQMLRARLLIVGVGYAQLQTERGRIAGIHIVQVGMLAGVLRRLRRARRGVRRMGAVPLSRIGQAEAVVVADGIVHAEAVVMVGAVAAVAGLVAVSHALSV